jgi:plastocyanin
MTEQERHDQQAFDEAVARKGKVVLQVLAGVGIVAALLMSIAALAQSGGKGEAAVATHASQSSGSGGASGTAAAAAKPAVTPTAAAKVVSLKIIGSVKKGPDNKMHDAFTVTNFNVNVGQAETLKIDNTDDVPHSITSPAAGVNIIAQPGVHTYTLIVDKAGKFEWYCMLPCDGDAGGWAMQHPGYMSGYITAA